MMTLNFPKYLLSIVMVLTATAVFLFSAEWASTSNAAEDTYPSSCRYGASASPTDGWVAEMNIGWTLDFVAAAHPFQHEVEYVPTIRINQLRDEEGNRLPDYELVSPETVEGLIYVLERFPGRLWQIGNEVDRVHWQDDIMPEIYAIAYHDLYHLIKAHDPTALIAPSGLVEVTPGRLQYLDIVWDTYLQKYGREMPVDVWNMHIYILPERTRSGQGSRAGIALGTDPELAIYESDGTPSDCDEENVYCYAEHDDVEIFKEQVLAMRRWMKDHNEQDKPLILTEFSVLYPFREESDPPLDSEGCWYCYSLQDEYGKVFSRTRVLAYMNSTLDYLETAKDPELGYPEDNYRLVQKWNWFSVHPSTEVSPNNLVHDDGTQLTVLGQNYKSRITQGGFDVNLHVSSVRSLSTRVITDSVTIPLAVTFRNNGNTPPEHPFKVTFYSDEAMTQEIGSTTVNQKISGCATRPFTVEVDWSGLQEGTHRFWVRLDPLDHITESDESDNVGTGTVHVARHQLLLPVARR